MKWWHRHDWEPRAVSHWSYGTDLCGREVKGAMSHTTLLEQCKICGKRRESEYLGTRTLADFKR